MHRRYKKWVDGGIFEKILCKITQELKEKNIINDAETFIDGSFIPALFCKKGGGKKVKYGRKGKGSTLMAIIKKMVDSKGLPLSLAIDSADRHEVKLVQLTFDFYYLNTYPDKVVGDKVYDSDDLDKKMKEKNINVIAPQVRIPLSGNGDYKVYDGVWGSGIFAGYETETHNYILATGISLWNFEKDEPVRISANLDLGFNYRIFNTSGHAKWETDFIYEDDGTEKLYIGPSIYLKITDTFHTKVIFKKEVHSRRNSLDHGNGIVLKIGLGLVF